MSYLIFFSIPQFSLQPNINSNKTLIQKLQRHTTSPPEKPHATKIKRSRQEKKKAKCRGTLTFQEERVQPHRRRSWLKVAWDEIRTSASKRKQLLEFEIVFVGTRDELIRSVLVGRGNGETVTLFCVSNRSLRNGETNIKSGERCACNFKRNLFLKFILE